MRSTIFLTYNHDQFRGDYCMGILVGEQTSGVFGGTLIIGLITEPLGFVQDT